MKRILVTGGAGFLGSHLCDRLVNNGDDIICVDNLFTGQKSNIAHLLHRTNFEFIRHDITFPLYLEVDEIYNLACPASPIHYQRDPIQTMKVSVLGMINMLGLAKRCNAKILQASTSEVYGDPEVTPQKEDYCGNVNQLGIRSCYDEGKRAAETLCMDYYRKHNVPVRIARIHNTYGPRMSPNDGRVISNFIVQALQRKPFTVYGTGEQTRSFCYVDDMVTGLMRLMASEIVTPVNLGNPTEHRIKDITHIISKLAKTINYREAALSLPEDDPKRRCPDITKAKTLLGWEPKISLEDGLKRTIDWFTDLFLENPDILHAV